jgi:hypothetical protein
MFQLFVRALYGRWTCQKCGHNGARLYWQCDRCGIVVCGSCRRTGQCDNCTSGILQPLS